MTTVRENDGTSLCFLFSRADIDEVETEVVEIEAKLDKVRLVFHCPAAAVLDGRPSGAFCFSHVVQRRDRNIRVVGSL